MKEEILIEQKRKEVFFQNFYENPEYDIFFQKLSLYLISYDINAKNLDHFSEINSSSQIQHWRMLFFDNIENLMECFDKWQTQRAFYILEEKNEKEKLLENLEPKRVSLVDKLALILQTKILSVVDKRVFLKQQAFFVSSMNKCLYTNASKYFCDLAWRYVGDKSLDFNFYSKRISLFMVYKLSCIFYLSDSSEGFLETKIFIRDFLGMFVNFGRYKQNFMTKFQNIPIIRMFL